MEWRRLGKRKTCSTLPPFFSSPLDHSVVMSTLCRRLAACLWESCWFSCVVPPKNYIFLSLTLPSASIVIYCIVIHSLLTGLDNRLTHSVYTGYNSCRFRKNVFGGRKWEVDVEILSVWIMISPSRSFRGYRRQPNKLGQFDADFVVRDKIMLPVFFHSARQKC